MVKKQYFPYLIILAVLLLWMGTSFYMKNAIAKEQALYVKKHLSSLEFTSLQSHWSKQNQRKELQRVLSFLDAFGIAYKKSQRQKRMILALHLTSKNANKVINFLLNRDLRIVRFNIKKHDAYSVDCEVSILL